MTQSKRYLVMGIGVDPSRQGNMGDFCPTWPDCPMGPPDGGPENPFNDGGYVSIKGDDSYTAIGGRIFDTEYAARGWLQFDPAGERFRSAFANVMIVRIGG